MNNNSFLYDKKRSFLAYIFSQFIQLLGTKTNDDDKIKRSIISDEKPKQITNSLLQKYHVEEKLFEGRPLWLISPKKGTCDQVVLYIHGGAYVKNIYPTHWKLIESILDATNTSFVVPDYPLAGKASSEDVFEYLNKLMPVFHDFRNNKPWIMMGDSAGGGLTYAFSQYMRDHKINLANKLILLSPWLDITMTNPLQKKIDKHDKMLSVKSLRIFGESYAKEITTTDYSVSPLFGNLEGLPPTSIFTGTYDILYADAKSLREKLIAQKIPHNFYEFPKLFHVFMGVTFLKEAKVAINQIAGLINGTK